MAHWKRVVGVLMGAALGTSVLIACTTPYAPRGITGGFTDRRLGPDLYAIEFRGNGNTSSDLVLDMYLYRCAELTLQNGFDVFVSRKPDAQAEIRPSDPLALLADTDPEDLVNYRSGGSSYTTIYLPGHTVTSYGISGQVRMGRYADVPSTQEVWDARAAMKTLEPFVKNNRTPALRLEEVAQVAVVRGRGQPAGNDTRTTLDDLSGLLGQH
jgi:hypothetical protein